LAGVLILWLFGGVSALAQASASPEVKQVAADRTSSVVLAVAIVVGVSCLAAAYAVARVGSAALGAASERPELLGRSLILVGLAEGIAIYGLIIGIMLLRLVPK
jgi:V/A-type H+-transporting ATPase subunit K